MDKNTVCDFVRARFEPGSGRRQKLRKREREREFGDRAQFDRESSPMSATCEFHGSIEWNTRDKGGGERFGREGREISVLRS